MRLTCKTWSSRVGMRCVLYQLLQLLGSRSCWSLTELAVAAVLSLGWQSFKDLISSRHREVEDNKAQLLTAPTIWTTKVRIWDQSTMTTTLNKMSEEWQHQAFKDKIIKSFRTLKWEPPRSFQVRCMPYPQWPKKVLHLTRWPIWGLAQRLSRTTLTLTDSPLADMHTKKAILFQDRDM